MMRTAMMLAALMLGEAAMAQPAPDEAVPPSNDYVADATWLCRPGRADVCSAPLDVATVAANSRVVVKALPAAAAPKVDCFYVYPTVSTDPGGNSDMTADAAERNVASIQFAAFRSVCQTFAPLYRQVTLAALRASMSGQKHPADRILAYADVADAWHDYLARDNKGRGVILIGHSQGAGILKALIQHEIDGRPVAARVIAAHLFGTNLAVRTDPSPGPRTDHIAGDVVTGGKLRPEWGLHLIDVNEALGNLVALAGTQAAAWNSTK